MVEDALEVIKHRNNFYRDSYHKIIVALFIALFVIVGLVVSVVYLAAKHPVPTYFATTDSGRIIPLVPLDRPNLSAKAVLQWASTAVVSVNSYNFVNFREAFQESRQYFTETGWRGFMKALSDSKNLDAVKQKRLVVSAVLTGAPIVNKSYVINGRYTWEVQMPILLTYQGSGPAVYNRNLVTLKIQRVSTLDNISGVGISEYVAQAQ